MKTQSVLFIGGTGTISTACVQLALEQGWKVTCLNRGTRGERLPEAVEWLQGDCKDPESLKKALAGRTFDVVADFIVFSPEEAERDIELFRERCGQYIFISSASVYQKPLPHYKVTESTPVKNPYWLYARNKIACEQKLMKAYREWNFPVTIIRPSHTYCCRAIPMGVEGKYGSAQILRRMQQGKPVIVHGDGTSLWTFTYSTDFAKGFCGLMGNPQALGETVHITSDEVLTWNQAYTIVANALGVQPALVHIPSDFIAAFDPSHMGYLLGDKSNSVVFDNSKIKRLVPGFCAQVRYDQGVKLCLEYLEKHPEAWPEDPEYDAWCDRLIARYFSGGCENSAG